MGSLVIKSWQADTKPIDDKNNHVLITGRKAGLIGWLLSLMGIDPVTKVVVGTERLEFSWASLSGIEYRLIPLQNIASTYYGYSKPWKSAIVLWFSILAAGGFVTFIFEQEGALGQGLLFLGWFAALGAVISVIYYVLNRRLTLGFVESSGVINAIAFKRSVVENVQIDQVQARNVSVIVQRCIEAKLRGR